MNTDISRRIGTQVRLGTPETTYEGFRKVHDFGMGSCQLMTNAYSLTKENADAVTAASREFGVAVTAVWAAWSGPAEWNFTSGPATLGLVPLAYRQKRLDEICAQADFAAGIGVTDVITHVGFLPENMDDPNFNSICACLRWLCRRLEAQGQYFLFETGQETPTTLLRAIETTGCPNMGVNLDTANLILYGRGSTVDAIDVIGRFVRNTHMKDGFYPTNGRELGREVPLGEGKANIKEVIRRLEEIGYTGCYCVEREISGIKQLEDIQAARDLIAGTLGEIYAGKE